MLTLVCFFVHVQMETQICGNSWYYPPPLTHALLSGEYLSYVLIDVPTNFCSLVHKFLPWRPARRRHSDHIHAAVHTIRLKCLSVIIRNQSGILWPSVLPLCKYYLHVLSLSDLCILQCTLMLIL